MYYIIITVSLRKLLNPLFLVSLSTKWDYNCSCLRGRVLNIRINDMMFENHV